jgi:hypothetical protein
MRWRFRPANPLLRSARQPAGKIVEELIEGAERLLSRAL